jgi:hypothetical protein
MEIALPFIFIAGMALLMFIGSRPAFKHWWWRTFLKSALPEVYTGKHRRGPT